MRCAIGLVDRIGGYDDAVKAAAKRADLNGNYGVRRIEPELTWPQQLLLQLRSTGDDCWRISVGSAAGSAAWRSACSRSIGSSRAGRA